MKQGIDKRGHRAQDTGRKAPGAESVEHEVDPVYINFATNQVISERFGDITQAVIERLRSRLFEATLRAPAQQKELARAAALRGERKAVGDLGAVAMEVHPTVYWHWRFREGPEAWGDKGFRKDLLRDNPELGVKLAKRGNRAGYEGAPRRGKPAQTGKVIYQGI